MGMVEILPGAILWRDSYSVEMNQKFFPVVICPYIVQCAGVKRMIIGATASV
jgi:hypothetical protein